MSVLDSDNIDVEEEREQSHLVNLLSDNSITTIEVGETRLLLWN